MINISQSRTALNRYMKIWWRIWNWGSMSFVQPPQRPSPWLTSSVARRKERRNQESHLVPKPHLRRLNSDHLHQPMSAVMVKKLTLVSRCRLYVIYLCSYTLISPYLWFSSGFENQAVLGRGQPGTWVTTLLQQVKARVRRKQLKYRNRRQEAWRRRREGGSEYSYLFCYTTHDDWMNKTVWTLFVIKVWLIYWCENYRLYCIYIAIGGTPARHWCNYKSSWYFCTLQASVTTMAIGGTLIIHQCNCQPLWHFFNPHPTITAMGIGGTSVIQQCNYQLLWCFCNLFYEHNCHGFRWCISHTLMWLPTFVVFCNPYPTITIGIGGTLAIWQCNY